MDHEYASNSVKTERSETYHLNHKSANNFYKETNCFSTFYYNRMISQQSRKASKSLFELRKRPSHV